MQWNRFVLSASAVAVVIAMSGCDTEPTAEKSTAAPAAAASTPAPATSSAAGPANDAATVAACADLKKDIKDNSGKVAKALKIGPPAGHIAVSAQWTAGSTAVIAHSIGANDAVSKAADAVQKEMMAVGEEYNKSPKAKPSMTKLDAAIKDLNAACSPS
jgi:hypothetical protein